MDRQIESIAVIGLGLIGASFAGAYRKAYPDAPILGVDVSQEAINELLDRGWITQGFGPNAPELPEALNTCDLVVIATPVGSVPEYFRMLADCDYQGIITDTCSTKAQIVEEAQAILPHLDHFIPGHPMAGSEKSGVTGSRDNLFENAHPPRSDELLRSTPTRNACAREEFLEANRFHEAASLLFVEADRFEVDLLDRAECARERFEHLLVVLLFHLVAERLFLHETKTL